MASDRMANWPLRALSTVWFSRSFSCMRVISVGSDTLLPLVPEARPSGAVLHRGGASALKSLGQRGLERHLVGLEVRRVLVGDVVGDRLLLIDDRIERRTARSRWTRWHLPRPNSSCT